MAIDLADKTSNGNDLTNAGATEVTSGLPFAASTIAIDLENSSTETNNMYADDSASLSITGDITVEAWIKPESLVPGGRNYTILAKHDTGSGDGISYIFIMNSSETLSFVWSSNGTNISNENSSSAIYTVAGSWFHVAATLDVSAQDCILYKDGSAIGSALTDGSQTSIFDGGQVMAIGNRYTNGAFWAEQGFDGSVDEVRIWNDVRTSTEISDNYQSELTGTESGLVAYYPFEALAAGGGGAGLPSWKNLLGVGQ